MLYTVLLIAHVFLALILIGLVLLQQGKGADAGAAFGSGASATVFGARGSANFFTRTTAIIATLFFVNSLALAYLARDLSAEPESIVERAAQQQVQDEAPPPVEPLETAPPADDMPPAAADEQAAQPAQSEAQDAAEKTPPPPSETESR